MHQSELLKKTNHRQAVCSRNVVIYITRDYIVRQTKNLALIAIHHDE